MSAHVCEAFSLRTYNYAEAHRIAVFLTPEFGLLRGVAYGARRSKSRFGSALEPMTMVRLSFRRREGQDLATIQGCEILLAVAAHQRSFEEGLYFSYFAELLAEFGREGVEAQRLFRLARAVLESVGHLPVSLLARYLELWMLQFEGVLPPFEEVLGEELAKKTLEMMRTPPVELTAGTLSDGEIQRLERWTSELIQCHLEKPIKSRRLLRELM